MVQQMTKARRPGGPGGTSLAGDSPLTHDPRLSRVERRARGSGRRPAGRPDVARARATPWERQANGVGIPADEDGIDPGFDEIDDLDEYLLALFPGRPGSATPDGGD